MGLHCSLNSRIAEFAKDIQKDRIRGTRKIQQELLATDEIQLCQLWRKVRERRVRDHMHVVIVILACKSRHGFRTVRNQHSKEVNMVNTILPISPGGFGPSKERKTFCKVAVSHKSSLEKKRTHST